MIPHVVLDGDPFDRGLRHGSARAGELRAFLDDGLGRLNHLLPKPVTMTGLLPQIIRYGEAISEAVPDLASELEGLASGAGITWDEAVLLQIRRELLGYRSVRAAGDCTTYARAGLLAQTVDLNGDLDDQIAVLEIPGRALVLSFAGLLGYLGVNSAGLAVGLNLVLGGEWGPGLPPYLAIRHLLDEATSVPEALKILADLPLASSRSFTLCDTSETTCVEALGGELRVVRGPLTAHTNHFLHPDFVSADEINVFARRSSVRRLDACRAGMSTSDDPEAHFALLSEPPICVPDNGDIRRERTVAAVVLLPARGELYVRPGNPAHSSTQVFAL